MGLTKDNQYSTNQLKFAQLGVAMAHPARVRILQILKEETIYRFEDFPKILNLDQSTIRKHLEKLKSGNLIMETYIYHQSIFSLKNEGKDELDQFRDFIF